MSVHAAIQLLRECMKREGIVPKKGLGEELFLFASTLMPVINVDLLIRNAEGQFLLTWRDDPYCGRGWHIPGGCVRFRESIMDRAQKTAIQEFGHCVNLDPNILHILEIVIDEHRPLEDQNERAHFTSFVIAGSMPDDFNIANQTKHPNESGYMQWFSSLPENLVPVQACYKKHWIEIENKLKGTF